MPWRFVVAKNRIIRVGRAIHALGGTGPMAVKPTEETVSPACRVCGGEVNPHGECVVCGTKQSDPPKSPDVAVASWPKSESDGASAAWLATPSGDARDEALRKWLGGEDTAFQEWIGVPTASGGGKPVKTSDERMSDDKVRDLRAKALEVDGLRAELNAMRTTLNRELANFRQGKFDPVKFIEESANLSKQLQTEFAKRKELEQEIQHIKKGSIAVIKYVKTQQLKAGLSPELKKRLEQEAKAREALDAQIAEQRSVNEQLRKQVEAGLGKLKPDQRELKKRELALAEREAVLTAKEDRAASASPEGGGAPSEELKRRFEEELRAMEHCYASQEEGLPRREEDRLYREKVLQAEQRKVAQAKALGGSVNELELKSRLEELKSQITAKEEEVRTKEKYLTQKMEELRLREQGLITEDIEAREQELQVEVKQQKGKTGIARLDDLMFGGIPFGTNASVYGPPYVGKEVLVDLFMAEGLKKGAPVLWILTDKAPADIREEMAFVLPGYEEYEKLGLVEYIDAYSKSMGADASDPNTTYIDDPTDHQALLKAVDAKAGEWKKKYPTYRLGFRSVSTLIAYLDPTTTFKFLQPFVGRRKRDKAVAFYVIEKGMHEEQEIQMLGSLMDGSIEFKVEQLKSFLCIKGICDVQSRGWIRYTYTKSSLSIGSFSLDHIK